MMTLAVIFLLFGVFIVFSSTTPSKIERDTKFERKRDEYRNAKYRNWD